MQFSLGEAADERLDIVHATSLIGVKWRMP